MKSPLCHPVTQSPTPYTHITVHRQPTHHFPPSLSLSPTFPHFLSLLFSVLFPAKFRGCRDNFVRAWNFYHSQRIDYRVLSLCLVWSLPSLKRKRNRRESKDLWDLRQSWKEIFRGSGWFKVKAASIYHQLLTCADFSPSSPSCKTR